MSFRKEQTIAGLFVTSLVLVILGLVLMRSSAAGRRYTRNRDEAEKISSRAIFAAQACLASGAGLFVISLVAGSVIAFGIGPSWMSKEVSGAKVEERIMLSGDGVQLFNEDTYDIPGARYYLRVRLSTGKVCEFLCPERFYAESRIGDICHLRVIGQRVTDYRRVNPRIIV